MKSVTLEFRVQTDEFDDIESSCLPIPAIAFVELFVK